MKDKILVVEKGKEWRSFYKHELEAAGYYVVTATDSKQALKKLQETPVDLIVFDFMKPAANEFDYLQKMMEVNRNAKVVINTDYLDYQSDFQSWVADAFLSKSSDLTQLKNTIDNFLHSQPD